MITRPRLTFSTGSLHCYSLDRAFALAAAHGFDGVEVVCDQRYDSRQPDNLRRLVQAAGLPVLSLHTPWDVEKLDGWVYGERAAVEQTVGLAEAIGAAHVVVHLPNRIGHLTLRYAAHCWRLPARAIHSELKQWIESGGLAALQARTPVKICIENVPLLTRALKDRWLTWWNTLAEWPKVHDYLALDTTHWATHGISPLDAYRAGGKRVRHVHLSNYADGQQHLPPPRGALDLDGFLRHIVADGFDGQVVVELNPHTLSAWDETQVHHLLAETVAFCRAALAQSETQPPSERGVLSLAEPDARAARSAPIAADLAEAWWLSGC